MELTRQHFLDSFADASSFSQNHEFEAITGNECYVLARALLLARARHG
jgi:hypothetical protein